MQDRTEIHSDDDRRLMSLLDVVLAAPEAPGDLVDRVVNLTARDLGQPLRGALDAALMPAQPSPELQQLIVARMLEVRAQTLPGKLDRTLEPAAPAAQLQEALVAMGPSMDDSLESLLDDALMFQAELPAGINDRILEAVERELDEVTPGKPAVIGRIQPRVFESWRYVAAALIVLVYGAGLWVVLRETQHDFSSEQRISEARDELARFAQVVEEQHVHDRVDQDIDRIIRELEALFEQGLEDGLLLPDELMLRLDAGNDEAGPARPLDLLQLYNLF